jgi:acyl-coenzyme A thioesterase PaaI-like protein
MLLIKKFLPVQKLLQMMKFWPPYLGAGVRVDYASDDLREIRVSMKQTRFNSNYVGVHFGGSLYSMCDPFFMFMMLENLGKDYIVWDKAAEIKFLKPGKGKVKVEFKLDEAEILRVKELADSGEKVTPIYEVYITNEKNEKVAFIKKTLYIKRK